MKKILARAWLFGVLLLAASSVWAADHAFFSVGINYLKPADSGYRDVYGGQAFYPEAQAGVRLIKDLYAVAGFGFYTKKGETPDLHLPAKSTQRFYTAGLAYFVQALPNLRVKIKAGAADASFKETALETSVSGSKVGFQAEAGILVLGDVAFTGLNLGYLYATGMVGDVKIKLGGVRASLCIGIRI